MAGNNLLIVGSYVWLDFSGISNNLGDPKDAGSLSYYMGLGGLYLIIDIKSNMTPGRFTTTLEARFVSRGIGRSNAGSNQDATSNANAATTTTVVPAPAPAVPIAAPAQAATIPAPVDVTQTGPATQGNNNPVRANEEFEAWLKTVTRDTGGSQDTAGGNIRSVDEIRSIINNNAELDSGIGSSAPQTPVPSEEDTYDFLTESD